MKKNKNLKPLKPAFSIAYAIVVLIVAAVAIVGLTPVLTRKLPNLSTSMTIKNPKGWYEAYNAPEDGPYEGNPDHNHEYEETPEKLVPYQRYCTPKKCEDAKICTDGKCKFTPPKGVTKFELFAVGGGGGGGSAVAQDFSEDKVSDSYKKSVVGKVNIPNGTDTIGSSGSAEYKDKLKEEIKATFIDDAEVNSEDKNWGSGTKPLRRSAIDLAAADINTYPTLSTDTNCKKVEGCPQGCTLSGIGVNYKNPFLDILKENKIPAAEQYYYLYTKTLGAVKMGQPSILTLMPEWVKVTNTDIYKARYFCVDKLDPDCSSNKKFYKNNNDTSFDKIKNEYILTDNSTIKSRKSLRAWATGCSEGGTDGMSLKRTVFAKSDAINEHGYKCVNVNNAPPHTTSTEVIGFDWGKDYEDAQKICESKTKTYNNVSSTDICSSKTLDCTIDDKTSWGSNVSLKCVNNANKSTPELSSSTEITEDVYNNGEKIGTRTVGYNVTCKCPNKVVLGVDYEQSAQGGTAGSGACGTIGVNISCVKGNGICRRTNIYPANFSSGGDVSYTSNKGNETLETGEGKQECKLVREDYYHADSNGKQVLWSSSSCTGSGGSKGCGTVEKVINGVKQHVCNDSNNKWCFPCIRMNGNESDHGCDGSNGASAFFQLGCNENSGSYGCGNCSISGGTMGYTAHIVNDNDCQKCGHPYDGEDGHPGSPSFNGNFDYTSESFEGVKPGTFNHMYAWYMPYVVKHLMFGTAGRMGEVVHTMITLSEDDTLDVVPGKQAKKVEHTTGKNGLDGSATTVKQNGFGKYNVTAKGGKGGIGSQKTDQYLLCHISDLQDDDENLPCYYKSGKEGTVKGLKSTLTVQATHPEENTFKSKVKMSTSLSNGNPGGGAYGFGTQSLSDFICVARYLQSANYWKSGKVDFFLEPNGYNKGKIGLCAGNTKAKYILPDGAKYSAGTGAVVIVW